MSKVSKEEIESIVVEVAEKVYKNSKIDVLQKKDIEPIITNLRAETEVIIVDAIKSLADAFYDKYN